MHYREFDNGVRCSTEPDARGTYRVRWIDPKTGAARDARRRDRDEAEHLARDLAFGIGRQQIALEAGLTDLSEESLAALVDAWLEPDNHSEPLSATYLQNGRYMFRRRLVPVIGTVKCRDWSRQHTEEVIKAARQDGLRESTLGNLLMLMRGLAKFGRQNGWLPESLDPCANLRVKQPRHDLGLDQLPRAEDIERLADMFAKVDRPIRHTQIMVLAYSGLRLGECLGLQARHVDLDKGTLRVEQQYRRDCKLVPPKMSSIRTTVFPVWLDDGLAEAVADADPDGPLFPGRHGSWEQPRVMSEYFMMAREQCGWPRGTDGRYLWSLHTLRHYFCTWALSENGLGLDVADVAAYAGHSSPATTWRLYVEAHPDRVSRARTASLSANR